MEERKEDNSMMMMMMMMMMMTMEATMEKMSIALAKMIIR